jgi:hypothetical protein
MPSEVEVPEEQLQEFSTLFNELAKTKGSLERDVVVETICQRFSLSSSAAEEIW